jgi:DNA repair protein RadA/Sms
MSDKAKIRYQCSACGGVQSKWAGQCADCGQWNSLSEIVADRHNRPRFSSYAGESTAQKLAEVSPAEYARTGSGMSELDRVLGGGIVRGSVVLIGGDPGFGKSTMLLQMMGALANVDGLYVTGEESAQQTSLRARRLGLHNMELLLLTETCVERI